MIKYILNVLNAESNPNNYIFKYLLSITFIYIIYLIWKRYNRFKTSTEGFTQDEPYILKKNEEMYDEFYAEIHDEIHCPKNRIGHELLNVINVTEPTIKNSVFLDIGSGTGDMVKHLSDAGYKTFGIDKSKAMVDVSEEKYPDCEYKVADALDPMCFEHKSFSHILCTYFTLYEIRDKITFFKNCYNWLLPNGYLVIHLFDVDKFDAVSPAAKRNLVINPNKYAKKRIVKSVVKFENYIYNLSYDYRNVQQKELYRKQQFEDKSTGHIREQEDVLYIDSVNNILKMARYAGFNLYSQFNMKDNLDDEYQYIYILERV